MNQIGTCKYFRQEKQHTSVMANVFQGAAFLLVFLMAMDFRTRVFYLSFMAFGLIVFNKLYGFSIPRAVLAPIILAVSLCLFSTETQGDLIQCIKQFMYPASVLVGYNLTDSDSDKTVKKNATLIILALAGGSFFHYLLNLLNNLNSTLRDTIDVWTKMVLSSTGQSLMAVMMTGTVVAILFSSLRLIWKLMAVGVMLIILYYNLILSGRTILVLFAALILINLIANWIIQKNSSKLIRGIIVLLIITAVIYIVIRNNLFGIMDVFGKSNLHQRFFSKFGSAGLNEDGRMKYKIMYLKHLIDYPFGKEELRKAIGGYYAHDIILDTYSLAGVFASCSVIIMLVDTIIKCVKICHCKLLSKNLKSVVLNVIFSVFLAFAMEPILQGAPWLFASFCVLYGTITRLSEVQYMN